MESIAIERIGNMRLGVGESPFWDSQQQAWFWVDILGKQIWRWHEGELTHWETPEMPGCIAPKRNGGFIAGMESGIFALDVRQGLPGADAYLQCDLLARPSAPALQNGMRFNDGRCDRQGRFWSGTMVMDMAAARAQGQLYRYTVDDGISAAFVSDLLVQNGLAWSPDGRTMYLSDSHPNSQLIWAFDYDTERGIPSHQRVFVDMKHHQGRPDGAAIDVDGCYWICGNDGARLLRFTPQGKLDREIALPMKKPAMCSFGGAHMDTLLVTSIGAGQDPQDEWAGAVVRLQPGVQGLMDGLFLG